MDICKKWLRKPDVYWANTVDITIDNKRFDVPLTAMGKRFVKARRVRFHLRTRAEGLKPGFTKPNTKRHRLNTGSSVSVLAGIVNCRVRVWHYLPEAKWNAEEAVKAYDGPIITALRKHRGEKFEAKSRVAEKRDFQARLPRHR